MSKKQKTSNAAPSIPTREECLRLIQDPERVALMREANPRYRVPTGKALEQAIADIQARAGMTPAQLVAQIVGQAPQAAPVAPAPAPVVLTAEQELFTKRSAAAHKAWATRRAMAEAAQAAREQSRVAEGASVAEAQIRSFIAPQKRGKAPAPYEARLSQYTLEREGAALVVRVFGDSAAVTAVRGGAVTAEYTTSRGKAFQLYRLAQREGWTKRGA